MSDAWHFCPNCGSRRVGYFRFCQNCKFDFDALSVTPPAPVPARVPAAEQLAPASTPSTPFVLTPPAIAKFEPPVLAPAPRQPVAAQRAPVAPPAPVVSPAAHRPPVAATARVSTAMVLARRASPLLRYAIIGLIGVFAVSVVMNMVSRSTQGSAFPTGGTAGATAVAPGAQPTTEISEPTGATAQPPQSSLAPIGPTQLAIVMSVVDGDTIRVDIDGEEYPLRYIGVDAPDPDAADPATKDLAVAATAANADLVAGRDVFLEQDVSETDTFDRLLRHVWVVDAERGMILVNAELVRLGFARVTTLAPDEKYADELTALQEAATIDGIGMWQPAATSAPTPVATQNGLLGGSTECHPSYTPCLPVVEDLDCADVRRMGLAPVQLKGPDEYRLDFNGDSQGCE